MLRRRLEKYLPARTVNLWCHISEGAFASFGGELIESGVVLSVLAARLGASSGILGVLTAINRSAFLIPLLFAPRVEAYPKKKRLVLLLGIGQRLPVLFISILLLLFAREWPFACLMAITAVNLMGNMVVSVLVAPWMELIAETVRTSQVGKLFGFRNTLSSLMGIGAGIACASILAVVEFPGNYAFLYFTGFLAMAVSWLIFTLVDEMPAQAAAPRPVDRGDYFRELFAVFKADRNYRRYLVYQLTGKIGQLTVPFYAYIAVSHFKVPEAVAAGSFITARFMAQIAGNLLFPFVVERIGHKHVLRLGIVILTGSGLPAAFAPAGMWYIAVFFLAGFGMAANTVAGSVFNITIMPRGRRIGYQGLSSLIMAPISIGLPVLVGYLIPHTGHTVLFALTASIMLLGLVPLHACRAVYRNE
jgi:MFS family permease